MGTPLVARREHHMGGHVSEDFRWRLISENFAKEYWHDARNALEAIRVAGPDDWREIVGVVGDVHENGVEKPAGERRFIGR